MLLANNCHIASGPCKWYAISAAAGTRAIGHVGVARGLWNQSGQNRNMYAGENGILESAGRPDGHEAPGSWLLPQAGGGLAAFNTITGAGDISQADLLMGKDLSAALIGSGDITAANLALIVSLTSTLAGSGALTASMSGALKMAAQLAGQGDISAAMGAIIFMNAALNGAGTLDGSNLTGLASLSAEILSYGELTPEGLRDAVWGALLEAGLTAEDLLRLAAASAAGKLSGAASTTITVRDVSDQHDLITATVDGDGNRSAVVLNLDQ